MAFLRAVRYSDADIVGFGDLGKMPEERLQELLRKKTEEAHALAIGKSTRWKPGLIPGGSKRRKQRRAR